MPIASATTNGADSWSQRLSACVCVCVCLAECGRRFNDVVDWTTDGSTQHSIPTWLSPSLPLYFFSFDPPPLLPTIHLAVRFGGSFPPLNYCFWWTEFFFFALLRPFSVWECGRRLTTSLAGQPRHSPSLRRLFFSFSYTFSITDCWV